MPPTGDPPMFVIDADDVMHAVRPGMPSRLAYGPIPSGRLARWPIPPEHQIRPDEHRSRVRGWPPIARRVVGILRPGVFATAGDPIGTGSVASLAQPGGNITGLSSQAPDTASKKLGLLHELVPACTGWRSWPMRAIPTPRST